MLTGILLRQKGKIKTLKAFIIISVLLMIGGLLILL
jgi:hypothetical protein